ncbi:MAG TPA: dephospho-CoA kinase [Steroidobacteraceae bacterium]|nr:dephospho-CoA kinase [Steroidobacteraceae bacterium]
MIPRRAPFRVGLTGGIASGKTTVARLFAALGVPVIDADVISREVTAPGTALLARIAERFGTRYLGADGHLDRRALRGVVFADPQALADLEALTHPAIFETIARHSVAAGGPYQILVLPLLVEKHHEGIVDRVLVVDCDEALQIRRLQARDGSTLEQARAILAAQAPRAQRLEVADDVITNDDDLQSLRAQVEEHHARYLRIATEAPP